ncbi:MAG: hypothetical protein ABWZ40_02010 [Caulobacterales bacterium]
MASQNKPKLAFCGVGQYGLEAVRIAAAKGWPIVGAVNRAGDKIGKDLGRLAGLDRDLGVIVQDIETADYKSFGADVGIVAIFDRLAGNLPVYERLMNAGINVVCHGAEAYFPWGSDTKTGAYIDDLAKRNGVSFMGTGIWDYSRIWAGILAAGPQTRIDTFFHRSITDAEAANLTMMKVCGVGMTQDEYAEKMSRIEGIIGNLYKTIPHQVLWALGYDITRCEERREPVLSDEPTYCRLLDETLAPGISLGTRIIAEVETKQGVTAAAHIELRILPKGENEHMVWTINGMPGAKVRVDRQHAVHSSAACLIHRAPDIIAAAPGIQVLSKLGVLSPHLGL